MGPRTPAALLTLFCWSCKGTSSTEHAVFTRQLFEENAKRYADVDADAVYEHGDDLVWQNNPKQWHQQLARIVDHRFSTFDELESFAKNAKKAGATALMLVQIQKSAACPGGWYNGLQLCDHINGSNPAADGTLEQWQALLQELKPMRLMWWANMDYWSVQGEVWAEAHADKDAPVGRWFSWNATDEDQCWGANVDGAQGSWGSDGASQGTPSVLASWGSSTYADYLVDAMSNSWTKNLGIDGYTIDCIGCYNKDNPSCLNGMLQTGGNAESAWAKIVERVREQQPQVVLSAEAYGSWQEVIETKSDIGGQGFGNYHTTMQQAVFEGNAENLEHVASTSGADAATVLCYLNPFYDGQQPGECPTMYFRDMTDTILDVTQHRFWVALEAGSGIVSQHDYGGPSNPVWWNVSNDPFDDAEGDSPLWAFQKYRALNRLALRTKLNATSDRKTPPRAPLIDWTRHAGSNCFEGGGASDLEAPKGSSCGQMSLDDCKSRCVATPGCAAVTFDVNDHWCYRRKDVYIDECDSDDAYDTYTFGPGPPPPPAPVAGGALAYLKHDSMGPQGDAAIMVFNPGASQNVTIDLSSLPQSAFGTVPYDLLGADFLQQLGAPPLAASWTVEMGAGEVKAFAGFGLGVFAPRLGKKASCVADDSHSRQLNGTTLQACFLECANDSRCHNVLVDFVDVVWMESPPPLTCRLLGPIQKPATSCKEGEGTLIHRLPGARSCAEDWQEVGDVPPAARDSNAVRAGPPSHKCRRSELIV